MKPLNGTTDMFYPVAIIVVIVIGVVLLISLITVLFSTAAANRKSNGTKRINNNGAIITLSIFLALSVGAFIFLYVRMNKKDNGSNNTGILTREATLNDLTIMSDDLDISSLSEKISFNPKCDIDNLVITFKFQKKDGTLLKTIDKPMGNVKEGNTYSVTISFSDVADWSIISNLNNFQCRYSVTKGTVSIFA